MHQYPSGIDDITPWHYAKSVADLSGFTGRSFINHCYAEITFMSRPPATTFEYLQFHAANTPDRVALIMDDGQYTYGRFADDALRFTKALADLGIQRRQIVSIHHPHFYIEWLLTIACENLGAVSVSDDARNWKRSHYLYQHVDVGLTNTPADAEPPFQYHCLNDDWVRATLRMDLAIAQKQPVIVPELDDLVRITRSSGSTGIPKLIPRQRRSQEYQIDFRFISGNHSSNSKIFIGYSTFYLNFILTICQLAMKIGANIIKIDYQKKDVWKYGITNILTLPLTLEHMCDNISNINPNHSELIIEITGGAIPKYLKEKTVAKMGANIIGSFGTNECNGILLMQSPDVGIMRPGTDLEIRDEKHRQVPDGAIGMIAARNGGMVDGYYKNDEETRKRFHDGWFYTGDAGIMVGPRKVKLLGRADDMVIMGGIKESPLPLEETLRDGAGITDAAVVGIKASDGGDLVCVALVLTDDANVEAIRASIHQLWAVYKVRIIIAVVDDLARTENGKVSRAKVREFFREQLEAEVAAS